MTARPANTAHDPLVSAARAMLARHERVVLAVSGGADSMALLHATAAATDGEPGRLVVASFDHGTGAESRRGVKLACDTALALGVGVRRGAASLPGAAEAELRRGRWEFLRMVSAEERSPVATAHTEDDQLETIVFRAMRGAGARGLAGLAAPSRVERPFLRIPASTVRGWVLRRGIPWVEDPSNRSRRHARNRLRHDLLPAIAAVDPGFRASMLALGERAAAWRAEVEALARGFVVDRDDERLRVAAAQLAAYDSDMLAVLWPALAAQCGVTLDWRGVRRLAGFTRRAGHGAVMPLSGGSEVIRDREFFVLRRSVPRRILDETPLDERVAFGGWRFERAVAPAPAAAGDAWVASLPTREALHVRSWREGDRLSLGAGGRSRRVARFLADARIPSPDREGWPVVLAGSRIVWIPGVRGPAAEPGTPDSMVTYVCRRDGV